MMALLLIILFVTTDFYEKVKIRRLKYIQTMRKQLLIYGVYADNRHLSKNSSFFHNFMSKRMTFLSKFTKLHSQPRFMFVKSKNKYPR
jgi:hypothetical protein